MIEAFKWISPNIPVRRYVLFEDREWIMSILEDGEVHTEDFDYLYDDCINHKGDEDYEGCCWEPIDPDLVKGLVL
jgi:hypothetical protein